jgi:O-antigen/teichoic acid export membrane protein
MGLFGEDFIQGSDILIILSIGQFVNLMTGLPGCLLQMTGRERLLKRSSIITLLFTIVCLPISIYFYSAIGGAIVSALSLSMHKLMCTYYVKKEFGFNTMCIIR